MQKGQLQQWGQVLMGFSLLACLKFCSLAVPASAGILAIANAQSISQNFPTDGFQFITLLVVYGIYIAIAIAILTLIVKVATYTIGLLLVKLDDFIFFERPAKLTVKGKTVYLGENTEFYVEVKNRYWSSIDAHVVLHMQIRDGESYLSHQEHIKWSGINSHDPVAKIKGRKSRELHFASVRANERIHINLKSNINIPVSPNIEEGHIFSLTALVKSEKLSEPKEFHFDVVVSYNDGKVKFKTKRVKRNEKRHYLES